MTDKTNLTHSFFHTVHPRCVYITSLVEIHEDIHIHNKLLYWIKNSTKTTCFGPLLWGHLQVYYGFLFSNHTRPDDGPIEEGRNMLSLLHI